MKIFTIVCNEENKVVGSFHNRASAEKYVLEQKLFWESVNDPIDYKVIETILFDYDFYEKNRDRLILNEFEDLKRSVSNAIDGIKVRLVKE